MPRRHSFLRRIAMYALAAATCVVGLPSIAQAQFGQAAGFGEVMNPYFLRRDLNLIVDWLELDQSQSVIVESLFFDYEDAHAESRERMVTSFQQMSEDVNNLDRAQMLEIVMKPFEAKAEEWETQRREFLENVQLLLGPDQRESWPEFERRLRRYKDIPKGEFSGERIDLFVQLQRIELEPGMTDSIAALLEEYEMMLHDALEEREARFRETRLLMMHALREEDHQTSLNLYNDQIESHLKVRNVNDEYRELIAATLPADIGKRFRDQVLLEGYPTVFTPTPAERVLRAAAGSDEFSADVHDAIVSLFTAYQVAVAPINDALLEETRDFEPKQARHRAKKFAVETGPERARLGSIADPTREMKADRDRIGREIVMQVRELMTREQFAALPGSARFRRNANDMMHTRDASVIKGMGGKQSSTGKRDKN